MGLKDFRVYFGVRWINQQSCFGFHTFYGKLMKCEKKVIGMGNFYSDEIDSNTKSLASR